MTQFQPGWLQDQTGKSVASLDRLPANLRRSLRREAAPSTPTDAEVEEVIADQFAEFLHQESPRDRPYDFAEGVMRRFREAGWAVTRR